MNDKDIVELLHKLTDEQREHLLSMLCSFVETEEEWLTVKQASSLIRCTPKTVRKWYDEGRLRGRKISERKILISADSLSRLRA